MSAEQLKQLPSVDEVVSTLTDLTGYIPRPRLVEETRRVIAFARQSILAGEHVDLDLAQAVRQAVVFLVQPSLRRVINATGVVLHTNLGRAPLPGLDVPGPYSNLEYDLLTGKRGRRDSHFAPLLERLLGRPVIAVNNGAAAVWLVLRELAGQGGEVIVSRGELIEIGDGFRIPDIMAESGARLVEVGTTNRTRVEDYRSAITPQTRLLMRVHPSNFRIAGFTGSPTLEELSALAREYSVPLYEDLGSGNLWDLTQWGIDEPTVSASFRGGVDLVSFSGDKLLGGPQAGLIAGRAELVERLRRNPMYRALRLDKLAVLALETVARHLILEQWDELPAARMIRLPLDAIRARADALAGATGGKVESGESVIGGGSTPEQRIPTWLVAYEGNVTWLERRLRGGDPPIVARIERDRLLIDLRTVDPAEDAELAAALKR